MNKYGLLGIITVAIMATILLETQANPMSQFASQLNDLNTQFLPKEFRNTNVSIDDIKRIYREKCKKVTGFDNSTLYKEIESGAMALSGCFASLANLTVLQKEMEDARPKGELDEVFHKYCQRSPKAETCVRDFAYKLQACMTREEQNQQAVVLRIMSTLLGFACSRGGDQIALFVAEQGPECLDANKEAISHCMNRSFHQYMPKDGSVPDLMSQPELLFTPTHCVDLQSFEGCVLHHLHQCSEITPANIVQSLFRFVKNETNCQAWMDARANERPILMASFNNTGNNTATSLLTMSTMSITSVITLASVANQFIPRF